MKKLKRSSDDQWVAGVCSGIGQTFDVDPVIVRLVFVFLAIATALLPVVATYLIAWIIVPVEVKKMPSPSQSKRPPAKGS